MLSEMRFGAPIILSAFLSGCMKSGEADKGSENEDTLRVNLHSEHVSLTSLQLLQTIEQI